MGRNRNRAPKYIYISKQQYLEGKNIPQQTPIPSSQPEIDPFHHSSIITMNPFSKEKGLFIPNVRGLTKKESNSNNNQNQDRTQTFPDFFKSQDSTKLNNFLNTEGNESQKESQSSGEKNRPIDQKNLPANQKKYTKAEEIKIHDEEGNPNLNPNSQTHNSKYFHNDPSNMHFTQQQDENSEIFFNKSNDFPVNIPSENKSIKNLEPKGDQKSNISLPPQKSSINMPANASNLNQTKTNNKNPKTIENNSHLSGKNVNVFQGNSSQGVNQNSSLLKEENTEKNTDKNGKRTLKQQNSFTIYHQNQNLPVVGRLESPQIKTETINKGQEEQKTDSPFQKNDKRTNTNSPYQNINIIFKKSDSPFENINSFHQKIETTQRKINNIETSFNSQGGTPSNKSMKVLYDEGKKSPMDRQSIQKNSNKKLESSKSFDQNQKLKSSNPKSPSHFSPSPKVLRDLEKAASEISDKIEQGPDYKKNFNQKSRTFDSVFELKAEILELKENLNQQIDKYEQLDTDYQFAKRNEEVLEARIMDYKERCEVFAEELNEIKGLQQNLGEQIFRLQEIEKVNENIKDFEQEALLLLNAGSVEQSDHFEKYNILKKELEIRQENEKRDKENQVRIMENIRFLEEEISDFQKKRESLLNESENPKKRDSLRESDRNDKINWSPRIMPPNSAKKENLARSPWDKTKLMDMLENFFESKISSFNIMLEKAL